MRPGPCMLYHDILITLDHACASACTHRPPACTPRPAPGPPARQRHATLSRCVQLFVEPEQPGAKGQGQGCGGSAAHQPEPTPMHLHNKQPGHWLPQSTPPDPTHCPTACGNTTTTNQPPTANCHGTNHRWLTRTSGGTRWWQAVRPGPTSPCSPPACPAPASWRWPPPLWSCAARSR